LLPGGNTNVDPKLYQQEPLPGQKFDAARDACDLAAIKHCQENNKPLLAVCRGAQILNVAYGGSLTQSIGGGHDYGYMNPDQLAAPVHNMQIEKGGFFAGIYGAVTNFRVTSIHRQGIIRAQLAKNLRLEGTDGGDVVEAFSDPSKNFIVGVQYHPEFHPRDEDNLALIKRFAKEVFQASKLRPHLSARSQVTVGTAATVQIRPC